MRGKAKGSSDVSVHAIRAAVLRKRGGPMKIESLELEGPREDELLVRLVASGICHTDIGFIDDWDSAEEPVVLGHEGAGVVAEVGRRVRGVAAGDHVVLSYMSCGRCSPCRHGRPADCDRLSEANFGFARLDGSNALERSGVRGHFFGQSSFATHSLATARNTVVVPRDLPLELLAPLGCGLQTGAGTVMNSLAVSAGAGIAVFGTGAVGLAAVMAARIVGATPIIGVDIVPWRLGLALELGATHVIDARREQIAVRIAEIAGKGVHFVVDTTGEPELTRLAVSILRPRGRAALLTGDMTDRTYPGGKKAIGVVQGDSVPQRFIPQLIDLHRRGLFPFDRLVEFYPFTQINRAVADARRGDTIKPVLRISDMLDSRDFQ
ncbi:MAG: NAD(P)-dependent alcohol dehydrogenase [Deltaproteobacteria bacterium]|nr:NAD(P)-dependent alcohol dehydrogenase [Deltaproteobacteria bacterium]